MLIPKLLTLATLGSLIAAAAADLTARTEASEKIAALCSGARAGSELASTCSTLDRHTKRTGRLQPRGCKYKATDIEIDTNTHGLPGLPRGKLKIKKSACEMCYDNDQTCKTCLGTDNDNPIGALGACIACTQRCDGACNC